MEARSKAPKRDDLTDVQRRWLAHVRRAEGRGEALTDYANRHGLKVSSLYEAKRRLRRAGSAGTSSALHSVFSSAKAPAPVNQSAIRPDR